MPLTISKAAIQFAALPYQLQSLLQTQLHSKSTRYSSTTAEQSRRETKFSFPHHSNPTAHQIFHLSPASTQTDIKRRCAFSNCIIVFIAHVTLTDYELVREHHPDAPCNHDVPSSVRHARFQAIGHAYDVLRGKPTNAQSDFTSWQDTVMRAELRRRRGAHSSNYWRHGNPRYHGSAGGAYGGGWDTAGGGFAYTGGISEDDRLKDRFIIVIGVMVCYPPYLDSIAYS